VDVLADHVHIFLSFSPGLSIAKVAAMLKSISPSVIFDQYPEVKMELKLWRSDFWEKGYFVRTVGDEVAVEVIRKYIEYHKHDKTSAKQLNLF
jgi:putative transposase